MPEEDVINEGDIDPIDTETETEDEIERENSMEHEQPKRPKKTAKKAR